MWSLLQFKLRLVVVGVVLRVNFLAVVSKFDVDVVNGESIEVSICAVVRHFFLMGE